MTDRASPAPLAAPGSQAHLRAQRADLLRFAQGARAEHGFGYLDSDGVVTPGKPIELWITCRMTHVFALGALAGEPPAVGGPGSDQLVLLAEHGVHALRTSLADSEHDGWFAAVDDGGAVVDGSKQAYGHAFVVLAASSAVAAGIEGGVELLGEALACVEERFWHDDQGLVVDCWDQAWSELSPYRGVNANMHTVEAFLAAGDVTRDAVWHQRAARIAERLIGWASANEWRIPEHFDERWQPLLEHHREVPAHPFQPYGATVGHGLEWARLLVAVAQSQPTPSAAMLVAATALAERAVADGWAADDEDGFVYTTDWSGEPVVRARMHWVAAEALNTAEVLHRVTGERRWADRARLWWGYVDRAFVDHDRGSWTHELDEHNRPSDQTWPGKPDVYHAYQAALFPLVPTTPSFGSALRARASGIRRRRT